MTRVWIAFGILAAILWAAFTQYNMATETSDEIMDILEKTELSAKANSAETEKLCEELYNIWDNKKEKLAVFLPHDELDETSTNIERILRLAQKGKYDWLYIECAELKGRMEELRETELVKLHNIL